MILPRPNVSRMPLPVHGGPDHAELQAMGLAPGDIIDFSVSTNPFGPPPGTRDAIASASVDLYPDSNCSELKRELSTRLGIPGENIVFGSGSTELIRLIALAYFGTGDRVVIPEPTYQEYEMACLLVGAEPLRVSSLAEPAFRLNTERLVRCLQESRPRGLFLCNPNNPTGQYLSRDDVTRLCRAAPGTLIILDEAYVSFTDIPWRSEEFLSFDNVIVVRSMTKDYALAGIRLGYAMALQPLISALERVKPPWNVSAPAQAAGLFVLRQDKFLKECADRIKEARHFLVEGLATLGMSALESRANFFLVKVGNASAFRRALLKKGVLVRDCSSFGLPEHIRIATRDVQDCRRLLQAIREITTGDTGYVVTQR